MYEDIKKLANELLRARSNFQLSRFVIGQHPTPEMQFYQIILELKSLIEDNEIRELDLEIKKIELEELKKDTSAKGKIEVKKAELIISRLEADNASQKNEIDYLMQLFNQAEKIYSRAEIEDAQFEYWKQRLTNNARAMLMGGQSVGHAYIESMQQAGVLEEFVVEIEAQKRLAGELE